MTAHNQPTPGTGGSVPGARALLPLSRLCCLPWLRRRSASISVVFYSGTDSGFYSGRRSRRGVGLPPPLPSRRRTPLPPQPPVPAAVSPFQSHGPWIAGIMYEVVPAQPLGAVPEEWSFTTRVWYCITKGKYVGVTRNNSLALGAVVGVSGGTMRSFKTQALALQSFNEALRFKYRHRRVCCLIFPLLHDVLLSRI
ncbi:hypothetical protein R3P38DRAFT_3210865 [Favolaschia claudopus]|uniref:Uncharacterized protein n=1 Tax=Favolaschia claudopus TaxID=2862362 RepID=A0AAW0AIJ9_9AGAR